ncbi:hypothetical protein [Methylobacter sp. S3L5C]|uniref:hypothetical protein n=1 Tax=Methylobacter sp. S3L5C TaxID=2839024 RepID=UPI001FAC85A6|nr:hypothetical protein [Methylobacter sp. S3L5C]UOA09476.1 hypothetical protein KKZ03_04050 [Methylobacter sp. S3L5C]
MFYHVKNKKALIGLALGLMLTQPVLAATMNFDSLVAGTNANSDSTAIDLGITFNNVSFLPSKDVDGIDIAGSEHWQIDTTASAVVVANGASLDGAYAQSNGLDARDQPVMMHLGGIFNLASFSLNASSYDGSSFGGYYNPTLDFLDINGNAIGSVAYTLSAGIFSATLSAPLQGVVDVLLVGGAVYDNVSINVAAVPVPGAVWLFGSALMGFLGFSRRNTKV